MTTQSTTTETADPAITENEFLLRFVSHMVATAGQTFSDGGSIEDYAREVAPLYWQDTTGRLDGPEACAEADIDCWEHAG